MPLKRLMYERADKLSDAALLSGAVNTIVNQNGVLYGDNTDGYGFMQSMTEAGFDCRGSALLFLDPAESRLPFSLRPLDGAASIQVLCRLASASTRLIEEEIRRIHGACGCRLQLFDRQIRPGSKKA